MHDDEWQTFTRAWPKALLGFQDGTFSMEQAYGLIEKTGAIVDNEIAQFACNVVSEIGGAPDSFAQTISLLRGDPTEDEILNFMNS